MNKKLLPILLILSLIGCCIEVDISVPGFPDMARYFGTSEDMIQWTLSLNFLGFCLSSLIWGPLSESFGRRRMLILGNILFTLGGLGCALGQSIDWIIACRFFQGFGASATSIIAIAMVADTYQGEKAARFNGILNSIITASMAIAPVAGGFINHYLGWRANYSSVALISLTTLILISLFIPETKPDFDPWRPKKTAGQYLTLFTSRKFMTYSFIPSIIVSGYLAFLGCGSFLYIDQIGTSVIQYSLYQGFVVASFSLVSFFSGRILKIIGSKTSVIAGALLTTLSAAALVLQSFAYPGSAALITLFMSVYSVGSALIYTSVFTDSMEIFPEMKGLSSSALMFMRMFMCSATMWLISVIYNGSLFPIACAILSLALIGSFLISGMYRLEAKEPAENVICGG